MSAKDPVGERLLVGNCLETLKTLDDASIDSIVTDPPYELGFMGKSWDASGIAYQVELWEECLRVLKPGGHLLAFGGTRTYHRMAVAIEDAGFEIRDSIHWTYGSGFPKSLNIAKSIEAKAKTGKASPKGQRMAAMGGNYQQTPLAGTPGYGTTGNFQNKNTGSKPLGITTEAAKKWDGWGTALKPSHEPIVVARKPLASTVAENIQLHGTGGLNIDAARIGSPDTVGKVYTRGGNQTGSSLTTNTSGVHEYVEANTAGRFPANTLLTHNHDCQQTGTVTDDITLNGEGNDKLFHGNFNGGQDQSPKSATVAIYTCTPNCPVALLDEQQENVARFFHNSQWSQADDLTPFIYQAKAGKKERDAGLAELPEQAFVQYQTANGTSGKASSLSEGRDTKYRNIHPTVKPVELMKYLITLVTPPKGTVLDPFLGSGTTAVAAVLAGFEWRGCELTEDYLPIIKGRVAWATKEAKATKKPRKAKVQADQLPLAESSDA